MLGTAASPEAVVACGLVLLIAIVLTIFVHRPRRPGPKWRLYEWLLKRAEPDEPEDECK